MKFKRTLETLALAGVLASGGCAGIQGGDDTINQIANGIFGGSDPYADQRAQQQGQQRITMIDTQTGERTVTYVGNQSPQPVQQKVQLKVREGIKYSVDSEFGHAMLITCNNYIDLNNDEQIDWQKEIIGMKNVFSKKENIMVIFRTPTGNIPPRGLDYLLFGPDGKKVGEHSPTKESRGFMITYEPGDLVVGNYTAIVRFGKSNSLKSEFEVKE